jgi:hypothetical protein
LGEVRRTITVLFEPGAVVELRAFGELRVRSGYFDNPHALAETAMELDQQGWQSYVTLNEVSPNLLDRAPNRIIRPAATTTDNDMLRRNYILVDVDPVRPADVSASNEEKRAAYLPTKAVRDFLRTQGWPRPIIADSGNGFHLLYRVNLPNA